MADENLSLGDRPQTPEQQEQFRALVEIIKLMKAGKPLPFELDDDDVSCTIPSPTPQGETT